MLASEYAALIAQDTGTRRERFNGAKPRGNGGATSQQAFETFMTYPDFPKAMGILCAYLELTGGYNGPIQNLAISALPERGGAYMGFVASAGMEEQLLTVFNSEGQLQSWRVSLRIDGDLETELEKDLESREIEEEFGFEYGYLPYKSEAAYIRANTPKIFDFMFESSFLRTALVEQFDYMHSVIGYRKRRMQWHNPYLWEYLGKWLNTTPAAIPSTERPGRDHPQSLVSDPVDEWLNEHGDDIVESEFDVTEISEKILRWVRERPAQQQFRKSCWKRERPAKCAEWTGRKSSKPLILFPSASIHLTPAATDYCCAGTTTAPSTLAGCNMMPQRKASNGTMTATLFKVNS
ncbi:hypothetical protein [Actinotignum sp. GS-2025b]|uniref:hypothetical protein n=1 Tax=Actinotignum sp. GS-2025b TaxID=3427275 RepID=UPI003F48F099